MPIYKLVFISVIKDNYNHHKPVLSPYCLHIHCAHFQSARDGGRDHTEQIKCNSRGPESGGVLKCMGLRAGFLEGMSRKLCLQGRRNVI